LAFEHGARPFTQSLSFLDRPVEEGEDVYSAGFPGLGNTTIWQFGQGMVSNARVRFPEDATDSARMMGPYIQHTAQVDPGNSGGPLLVTAPEVLTGYAVAGINTLSARGRQAANFTIPIDRAIDFLAAALGPQPVDNRIRLEDRISSFTRGLQFSQPVYRHIAKYLSNRCTAENAEYAIMAMLAGASGTVIRDIMAVFNYSPVEGMNLAVAWTIENALRTNPGPINLQTATIERTEAGGYDIGFLSGKTSISAAWVNEYGIWRIRSFGAFAAGDKNFIDREDARRLQAARLRTNYLFSFSAGYGAILDPGISSQGLTLDSAFHLWLLGFGVRIFYGGPDYLQGEGTVGLHFPIRFSKLGLTPFVNTGIGFVWKDNRGGGALYAFNDSNKIMDMGISAQAGLRLTSSLVPGLFLQGAYQYSYTVFASAANQDPHLVSISIGYGF
jgi:serine protease Do